MSFNHRRINMTKKFNVVVFQANHYTINVNSEKYARELTIKNILREIGYYLVNEIKKKIHIKSHKIYFKELINKLIN
jgi:hypothetical protein